MLNKQAILDRGRRKVRVVSIPEWATEDEGSGDITIRQLTAAECLGLTDDTDGAQTIALSVVDEAGERVFSDDDVPAIRELAAAGRFRLNRLINEFNGLQPVAESAKN